MITRAILPLVLAVLVGCQSPTTALSPTEAIMKAAHAAPRGVKGVFEFTVQATGEQNGFAYLNSELDYRDQRNLTIAIPPGLRRALTQLHGQDPKSFYRGKRIRVSGEAMRVTIYFFTGGLRTSAYYYQTHVTLSDPKQIETID